MKIVVGILAGGSGERSGLRLPKQLVKLAGRPVIAHTIQRFEDHPLVDEIVIAASEATMGAVADLVVAYNFKKVVKFVSAGTERFRSAQSVIGSLDDYDGENTSLLTHDAVRPLVDHNTITDVIVALRTYRAVDVAIPATDTIIKSAPNAMLITEIPDRRMLHIGQTPQGFRLDLVREAYKRLSVSQQPYVSDDCGIVRAFCPEEPIYIVRGTSENVKLTYEQDLLILDRLFQVNAGRKARADNIQLALGNLRSKSVVVFGGTSGIGESISEIAISHAASVSVASRRTGVDVRNLEAVSAFLEEVSSRFGCIDAVINCTSVLQRGPIINLTSEQLKETVDVNLMGSLNVAQASYQHLRRSKGSLILFGSSSYSLGRSFYSPYSATKAAVVNLVQALADEWAVADVRVNCVNPERTNTPMRRAAFGVEPAGTLMPPEQVAARTLWLLSQSFSGFILDVNSETVGSD